jgi:hypothetical protein
MDRGTFKSCQGFLVHLSRTYEDIKPYIHELFLAENSWRDNRNAQGYRFPPKKIAPGDDSVDDSDSLDDLEEDLRFADALGDASCFLPPPFPNSGSAEDPPKLVLAVPQLHSDMDALCKIFAGSTPIQSIERPVSGARCVVFGGGDASGEALAL